MVRNIFLGECPPEMPRQLWKSLLALIGKRKDQPLSPGVLSELAAEHLEVMCRSRNKGREDAFGLLTIDALATYACELTCEEDDMRTALNDVFEMLKAGTDSSE